MSGFGRRGRGWEATLRVWHDQYRREGRGWIVHTSPPIRRTGGSGGREFTAVFSGKGPPDFVGVLDGHPVVFDAKEHAGPRWPTDSLTSHQALDLEAATRAGAFAFVALRIGRAGFVLPWPWLKERWRQGSLVAGELEHPFGAGGWAEVVPW